MCTASQRLDINARSIFGVKPRPVPPGYGPAAIAEALLRGVMFWAQMTDQPDDRIDNLFQPTPARGEWDGEGPRTSFYTRHLELYPNRKRFLLAALCTGVFMLARRRGLKA